MLISWFQLPKTSKISCFIALQEHQMFALIYHAACDMIDFNVWASRVDPLEGISHNVSMVVMGLGTRCPWEATPWHLCLRNITSKHTSKVLNLVSKPPAKHLYNLLNQTLKCFCRRAGETFHAAKCWAAPLGSNGTHHYSSSNRKPRL